MSPALVTPPETWDHRFLKLAQSVAGWSKDPDRGVGALLVSPDRRQVSYGYNGFPAGIEDDHTRLHTPELKLRLTVHAELNALLNCTFEPSGGTLYCTEHPCHECAKAILQKRVARVVAPSTINRPASKWAESWKLASYILSEGGVTLSTFTQGVRVP